MKTQLALFHFNLPLREKIRIMPSHVEIASRDIGILRVSEGNRVTYGEVSPLPGLSEESFQEITKLENLELPSLSFALSSARWLNEFTDSFRIPLCGLVLEQDSDNQAAKYESLGYGVIKLKVGRNFARDNQRVQTILKTTKKIKLRLDFNNQGRLKECESLLQSVPHGRLEYVEDPPAEIWEFLRKHKYSIAVDQNNVSDEGKRSFIKVIKPTCVGVSAPTACLRKKKDFILSSCFESNLGIYLIGVGARKWKVDFQCHGIDTAKYFRENIFEIETGDGALKMPDPHFISEKISSLVKGLKPIKEREI